MTGTITSQRGFSIIEALVAFGILAVGMIAVATMITTSMHYDRQSMTKREAYNIALEKFEQLKGDPPAEAGPSLAPIVDVVKGYQVRCEFTCVRLDDPPSPTCAALDEAGFYACCQQVKIIVGWGDASSCTTSNPSLCPHSIVFWNRLTSKVQNQCP